MTDPSPDVASTDSVEITRTLDAPAALVWEMWTDPEHFAAWYGPTGADVTVGELDVRPGGRRFVGLTMPTPDGSMEMWFVGDFTEVVDGERLAYTESIADADGNVLSPTEIGMPDNHPTVTEVIVRLHEHDGRTTMTMQHVGVPEGSPGEMGWNMAFDALESHLGDMRG